jgi:hypothetical protein
MDWSFRWLWEIHTSTLEKRFNNKINPTILTTEEIRKLIIHLIDSWKITNGNNGIESTPFIEQRYKSEFDEIKNTKIKIEDLPNLLKLYSKYLKFTNKHLIRNPVSFEEFIWWEWENRKRFEHIEWNNIIPWNWFYVTVANKNIKNIFEATEITLEMFII